MMTRPDGLHKGVVPRRMATALCAVAALLSACGSVPGETLASGGVRRDVTRRILAQATAAAPQCKTARIADTEVLEVYPNGKVAEERWTVEQCGSRLRYRVGFPPPGKTGAPQVRAE